MDDLLENSLVQKPQKTLYHYTTQIGLLGIISKKEIWATHNQYLNDSKEYLHALEILGVEISRKLESLMASPSEPVISSTLMAMWDDFQDLPMTNVCVVSFSEEPDSLPQWRAYGGPTSGFAIGFKPVDLVQSAERERFYLAPCVYSPASQLALVQALIDKVLKEILAGLQPGGTPHTRAAGNMRAYLHRFAPLLKHAAFAAEREWRLISRPLTSTHRRFAYRPGGSTIIPYFRFPLADGIDGHVGLDEIVIGPCPHPDQSEAVLKSFLVNQNLDGVTIRQSIVPYRNW